ncbi:MAG: hypothetical protein NC433_05235 [Clostridiales bacterium]|nr:hypothetical protein [Clostridiales bacterium]
MSDAFEIRKDAAGVELTVRMLNINFGQNKELLGKCRVLSEYAEVVGMLLEKFDIKKYENSLREEGKEEGKAEGREEGLRALIVSLSLLLPSIDAVHQAVIKNEAYRNVSKEQVEKYYK